MDSEKIVENAIKELENEFKNNQDRFFNEHALHHVFFCKLSELGDLVHPEYPTRKRFKKDKGDSPEYISGEHSCPPSIKGPKRGHYDFVVLKQEFYDKFKDCGNDNDPRKNKFERLSSKDFETNLDLEGKEYLDIVIEFKYVTESFSEKNFVDYDFDIFKLKEAEEAKTKIFLVFLRKRKIGDKMYKEVINWLEKRKEEEKDNIKMLIFTLDGDYQTSLT